MRVSDLHSAREMIHQQKTIDDTSNLAQSEINSRT